MTIEIQPGEVWYGPWVHLGFQMPIDGKTETSVQCMPVNSGNQVQPLMLSNQGRYLWADEGFNVEAAEGQLHFTRGTPVLSQGHKTLKGAFLHAAQHYFPADGQMPPETFFSVPQYNTWIELTYHQTQEAILKYAHSIIDNHMPPGILMIDDNWSEYYGGWRFNRAAFPDPKGMIEELHRMGFQVMLWICPFITPDRAEFRELRGKGLLVHERNKRGVIKPKLVDWWNGFSAVLDMSNPEAAQWLKGELQKLMDEYGIDGFKLDAGDAMFYEEDDITFAPIPPNGQCEAWGMFGLNFPYNEYRACYKCAGKPLVQRLCDKNHRWKGNGLDTLIPNTLMQGLLGYAFTCPDMVGGGEINDLYNAVSFDPELFVRNVGAACLLPMIQFSAAPWRVLSPEYFQYCMNLLSLREKHICTIMKYTRLAARTGEPVVRYLEYEFPGQGYESVTDQFMIGDKLLVAPVLEKGAVFRTVLLPAGRWIDQLTGETVEGGCAITAEAGLDQVPVFIRC